MPDFFDEVDSPLLIMCTFVGLKFVTVCKLMILKEISQKSGVEFVYFLCLEVCFCLIFYICRSFLCTFCVCRYVFVCCFIYVEACRFFD